MKIFNNTFKMADETLEQRLNDSLFCPECHNSTMFDRNNGFIYCRGCGLEITSAPPKNRGKRTFTPEEKNTLVQNEPVWWGPFGCRTLVPDNINSHKKASLIRLRKIQNSLNSSREVNYSWSFPKIDQLKNDFPDNIVEKARRIYIKCFNMDLVKGAGIERTIGASTYAACRIEKLPWLRFDIIKKLEDNLSKLNSFDENSKASRRVYATYKRIINKGVLKELQKEIDEKGLRDDFTIKKIGFINYLNTYCSRLGVPPKMIWKLSTLAKPFLNQRGYIQDSTNPAGIIAALIYSFKSIANRSLKKIITKNLNNITGDNYNGITQAGIAKYLNVTEVTLRSSYYTIKKEYIL
ncbi:hypothetical protein GF352_04045 [archaeon]|nr:hypothetical protein [archaeon]